MNFMENQLSTPPLLMECALISVQQGECSQCTQIVTEDLCSLHYLLLTSALCYMLLTLALCYIILTSTLCYVLVTSALCVTNS